MEYMKRKGLYYKSVNDISTDYIIEVREGRFEGNALVKIYSTQIPTDNFDEEGFIIESFTDFYETEVVWMCDIDLCGKYFFPTFKNDMQLYYDDEKYYDGKHKTNSIASLMDCINFAIDYGLETSGIKPY